MIDRGKVDNPGVSVNRNIGIREAQSDFIALLDADDEWAPDHLEALLELRKRYPDAGLYGTIHATLPPSEEDIKWRNYLENYSRGNEFFELELFKVRADGARVVNSSSSAIDRAKAYERGLFCEYFINGEDTDFWFRMALKYLVVFSLRGMAFYHIDRSENGLLPGKNDFDLNRSATFLGERLLSTPSLAASCFLTLARPYSRKNRDIFITACRLSSLSMGVLFMRDQKREAFKLFVRIWRYYGRFPQLLFCTFYPQILISFWLKLPYGFRQKLKYFIPGVVKRRILGDEGK